MNVPATNLNELYEDESYEDETYEDETYNSSEDKSRKDVFTSDYDKQISEIGSLDFWLHLLLILLINLKSQKNR
jgi:hypothetical protein